MVFGLPGVAAALSATAVGAGAVSVAVPPANSPSKECPLSEARRTQAQKECEATARALISAAAWLVVATRKTDARLDLEGLQGRILQLLRDREPRVGSNLAEYAGVSTMAISKAVTALERRGLVERYLCTEDRRMVRMLLTDKGADLVAEVEAARANDLGFFLGYHGKERHEELRQAAQLMEELGSRVYRFRRAKGL